MNEKKPIDLDKVTFLDEAMRPKELEDVRNIGEDALALEKRRAYEKLQREFKAVIEELRTYINLTENALRQQRRKPADPKRPFASEVNLQQLTDILNGLEDGLVEFTYSRAMPKSFRQAISTVEHTANLFHPELRNKILELGENL